VRRLQLRFRDKGLTVQDTLDVILEAANYPGPHHMGRISILQPVSQLKLLPWLMGILHTLNPTIEMQTSVLLLTLVIRILVSTKPTFATLNCS